MRLVIPRRLRSFSNPAFLHRLVQATLTMNSDAKQFLFRLLDTPSPSGFETEGQKVWMEYIGRFADSLDNDAYGNAWATLTGRDPAMSVMLEAHADEIGFMVQNITDDGFLYVTRIGGSDRAIARGKRLQIFGDQGSVLGVLGNTAIHLRNKEDEKIPEVHQLYVDIGATSKAEVEQRGLRIGHPAVYTDTAQELIPGRIIGRAIDNRISGFILSQVLANLSHGADKAFVTVHAVNAVQEEIGGSGAKMIAYRLQPRVAIVLDVTHATDSPGVDKNKHGSVNMGAGPTLTHGTANHPLVVDHLIGVARELQLPVQHEASSRTTGTDTDSVYISRSGIPSALVAIPMRYMHSTVELIDISDVERCITLLTSFIRRLVNVDEFTPRLGGKNSSV